MTKTLLLTALLGTIVSGCNEKTSSAPDLDTPLGAARCQIEAIQTKSTKLWYGCMHPDFLKGVTLEQWEAGAAKVGFWEDMAAKNAKLGSAKESDFALAQSPDARYGDQVATFPFERDKFEVWRKDGRWYIVDTGI